MARPLVAIVGVGHLSPSTEQPPPGYSFGETSEINHFGASVQTLGEGRFPDVFAGAVMSPDGHLTVYANAESPALETAIADINPNANSVTFVRSRFSWNQLEKLNHELGTHARQLLRDGVRLNMWGPEPPYDAVYVTVLRPTDQDLGRLSGSGLVPASLIPVTQANYIDAVSAAISGLAGPDYRVHRTFGYPIYAG